MRVLLINPPVANKIKIVREGRCMQREDAWGASWAPLTLATMGAVLKAAGFDIQIIDCTKDEISIGEFQDIVKNIKPGLVIINTATPSIDNDLSCASYIKEADASVKTAFFGIHVSALDTECLTNYPRADFIIRGEPEYTARDLAAAVKAGAPYENIEGISWQRGGSIYRNRDREFIKDLDMLPYPAWEDANIKRYTMPITGEIFLLVMTSRGCPYSCTFCSAQELYGKKRRYRSAERIVDEMEYVHKRFGVNSFLFWAEGFVADKQRVYEVCGEIIKRGLVFKWVANSRVDAVDLPMLKRMKEAGCWMIGYGIESGNQDILDAVKKGITLAQIEAAVKMAKQAGIKVTSHVIIGIPGETRRHILRTSSFVNKLGIDFLQLYCFVPFPGSVLYDEAKKNGWLTTDDWQMFEQNFSVLTTPQISAGEVMALRKKVFRSFYLNPRRALRIIRGIKSLRGMKNFIRVAKNFAKWT